MSLLLSTGSASFTWLIERNDDTSVDPIYGYNATVNAGYLQNGLSLFTDVRWPRSRFALSGAPAIWDTASNYSNYFGTWFSRVGGIQSRYTVTGLCLDSTNTVINNATVLLFDTPTNVLVDTSNSDSGGYYLVASPYSTNVYAVSYKSGSPDIAGTTINTIPG